MEHYFILETSQR